MKITRDNMETLGNPGGPRAALGGAAQRWNPPDYHYYERQWRTQRGAWGAPETADRLNADVAKVIAAFQTTGTRAGLAEAHACGLLDGARLYVAARGNTEEELAVRIAALRAAQAVGGATLAGRVKAAFLEARIDEVRKAGAKGHTPPQAVIDRPEVPRRMVPRWVSFTALALSVFVFFRSFDNGK